MFVVHFEKLWDNLSDSGVVSVPLDHKLAMDWIHNPVIVEKKYGDKIQLTVDMRPMAKAVKTAKFPIETPMELQNKLKGSDRFFAMYA